MTPVVELLDYLIRGNPPGVQRRLVHMWPWPHALAVILLLVCVGIVAAIYWRERASRGGPPKWLPALLRMAAITLTIFGLMYGWMLARDVTDLPDLILVVDDSASMLHTDVALGDEAQSIESQLAAAGYTESSRWNLARSLLLGGPRPLLAELQTRYNVHLYRIAAAVRQENARGSELGSVLADATIDRQEAVHASSRLGAGLRAILENQRGRPTAAVVMFTDGITTEGRTINEAASYAQRMDIPLFFVGLGNDQPAKDVRLQDVLAEEVVFVGDMAHFDAKFSAPGFEGQRITLQLTRDGMDAPLASREVIVGPAGESQTVRLSYRPLDVGDFAFAVEAVAPPGDVNTENNRRVTQVSVRDETIRVLYVQEYPSFEFRYLKTLLERVLKRSQVDEATDVPQAAQSPGGDAEAAEPQGQEDAASKSEEDVAGAEDAGGTQSQSSDKAIDLTVILQEADLEYATIDASAARVFPVSRDELFRYDVVIFGDVNPAFFSQSQLENLADFVRQRGGGLIFSAGVRHTPLAYRGSPLADLLPIQLESASVAAELVSDQPLVVRPTPLGTASPLAQLSEVPTAQADIWRSLPPLYWTLAADEVKPGARVLIETSSRYSASQPVVAIQFVGAGKVMMVLTDETYRWAHHPAGDQYYQTFWLQTVRYLSRAKLLGTGRAAELTTDRESYRLGDPVTLRARFLDDRLAPESDDGVTVVLEQQGGSRRRVVLHRDTASRGLFLGLSSDLGEGNYRAWLAEPVTTQQPPSTRFTVQAPQGEQGRLEMDSAVLRDAAQVSRGRFYTAHTADQLLDQLPAGRQVRIESLPPEPLWNSSFFVLLLIGLLCGEWLLRKQSGLM